ncbi:Sodium/hydrogen exchanger 8 [Willisornis vidua]|uniref:Sodium/hydrogen exchanger 8 n=1 Tax=Willisornis vidua TaxID=1566151 RepID=A0ABQ9D7I6_9PASS|nr:Sodium/hydrogen exchanger 8 [Willisornis vidua]
MQGLQDPLGQCSVASSLGLAEDVAVELRHAGLQPIRLVACSVQEGQIKPYGSCSMPESGSGFRSANATHEAINATLHTLLAATTKLVAPTPPRPILPVQTGVQAQQEEQSSGMTIFFSLLVIAICIILVHLLIEYRLHFLPESVAVVSLGILMGAFIKIIEAQKLANWKGNFFQNIGSIILFSVFGTAISAFIVGGGIYFLGRADVIYKLNMTDSFAFGSLISAVDPVATIAIFNALNVDPVLNMLVFGESILNDAVSIVLTKKTPSLEFGMMIIFAYLPYGLAEGISLSGIMAILFSGIVMSHYTHHNLSPVTQILMQQTLRTVAFMCGRYCLLLISRINNLKFYSCETVILLGAAEVLVLFGRAVNIFPLSYLLNFFRDHKITPKMMFIMWFSGLRGAIPYALSLHLGLEPIEKRQLIGTTTIIIVLFTILLLGGGTMPLIRLVDIEDSKPRKRNKKDVNLSKTEKMGNTIESEHLSELTEEEYEAQYIKRQNLKGFMRLDVEYLNPFFTRRLTQEDLHDGRIQMKTLTNKWYEEVRQGPSGSEDDEQELLQQSGAGVR